MILLKSHFKLNCTKEIFNILITAEKLALTNSHKYIEPIHIFLSIYLTKNIISSILFINKKILNKLIKQFFINNLIITSNNNIKDITFSIESLKILNNIFKSSKLITSMDLIILLLNWNNNFINLFLNMLPFSKNKILELIENSTKNINTTVLNKNTYDLSLEINNLNLIERNNELNTLIDILSKKLKNNVILIGESGTGRTSIIYSLLKKLKNSDTFPFLQNKTIKFLNLTKLTKISQYKGEIEEIFNSLINTSKKDKNLILICLDIYYLFTLFNNQNNSSEESYSSISLFKDAFEKNYIQLIGVTTPKEYSKLIKIDPKIEQFFDKIIINEPKDKELFDIINTVSKNLESYYKIKYSPNILNKTIDLSKLYIKNKFFPNKALEILDTASIYQLKENKYLNNMYLSIDYVYKAVSTISNLPENIIKKVNNKNDIILNLETKLKQFIFGQDLAIEQISNTLKIAYLGLKQKHKPLGSWILCGPSGTGKTELAKKLAEILFGSEKEMIRFDMSEYMEKHSLSKLIGTAPGYVGYGEGGQLTEAVNKKPYSILLFDEIEKAHPDISNIMLQILDDGRLTDSSGKNIDFSNTIILFTSNLGCSKNINEFLLKDHNVFSKNILKSVSEYFKPEFINRLNDIIIFNSLNINNLIYISTKFLNLLQKQLIETETNLSILVNKEVKIFLSKLAYNPIYGARSLKRLIENLIEKPISDLLIKFKFKTPHTIIFLLDKNNNKLIYQIKKN
uniref:ATP-dependent Clp protease ATP-binding subunit n=1 Tax=Nephromyces sp. ex Molgula occidentalis TaxID=2544991 RepID=A0A5C1H7X2_9APIC|nr:ATP-dependent Clp protease ATP-binding subunit [Nephromyces sp. ex Molgula occidentalis]